MPSEQRQSSTERDTRTAAAVPGETATVLRFPTNTAPSEHETTTPLRSVVGDVLRDERHAQRRTLADVANDAAVSLAYLSEIERGRKEISSELLAAVGQALELDLVDILERCVDRLRAQGGSGIQLRAA
jgi:hypothetical protein